MKAMPGKRIWAVVLALSMLLTLIPVAVPVEAEAVSGVNSLTCADFISNPIPQKYIDTMMRYYINSSTTLQNTLNNGLSVVFMFEGGSDNYWNGTTYGGYGTTRNQAVVIVVKKDSSGNAYIAYYCENCSSIPDQPTQCTQGVGNSGSTTLMDGTYSFYTWNHTGPYGAFQINVNKGYYTPTTLLNGQVLGASGINIHTRSTNLAYSGNGVWSAGCQVIGSGAYTGNEFNQFMKVVAGISFNVWKDYYNKSFNTISTGTTKGYYVVDRQLGMMDINGNQFGSGSLIQLYNATALNNIAAASTNARNKAGFSLEYKNQCTRYASYCKLEVIEDQVELRAQPCSAGTDAGSTLIEYVNTGDSLTATGIYQNGYGNYWYEVITSSGEPGYVYAGNVKYIDDIISDLVLTGAVPPNGHVQGTTFYVNGTVKTTYNELSSVACWIYSGFGTEGEIATGQSEKPSTNTYVLKGSTVDDDTWMGALALGNYTYQITGIYTNYYATSPTTLESNTGTLELMNEYFAVIPASADQSACVHTNTTHALQQSTCVSSGNSVTVCSTCGLITESVTSGGHSYGDWSVSIQPGCTQTGVETRTCTACGDVDSRSVAAAGHTYTSETHPATCVQYERIEYTCSDCGHKYSIYANELMTQWMDTKPEGIAPGDLETKEQYRYSDYETLVTNTSFLEGYTLVSKEWVKTGGATEKYVPAWAEGFDTGDSITDEFGILKIAASETTNSKTVIDSDLLVGYIYYHWCRGTYANGPINRFTSPTKSGEYVAHHAFYKDLADFDPTVQEHASDNSIVYPNADCCTDSHWYYYFPVYAQTYSRYTARYTYERWTDYTDWSDEAVTASDTRKVETRTVYRYSDAKLGDHAWAEGVCTVCGKVCEHSYENRLCTICGMEEPIKDYYLFGFIDGANYGCESDYQTIGKYLFVDGKLVVTFQKDSYVGVKSGDNEKWYMTDGWQGTDKTSVTLYDAANLESSEKFFVPGGVELTFTLRENEDETVTLSYEITYVPIVPTLSGKSVALAFEDEIFINVYFEATDLGDLGTEDMGLVSWSTARSDGTVDNAEGKTEGAIIHEASGYYRVRTQGIPAKKLGDTVYFKIYLRQADGSYIYSKLYNYSPKTYAQGILSSAKYSEEMKALAVAMVNYGAAAQEYFNYKPYDLVNSFLTDGQKAMVEDYRSEMVSGLNYADKTKLGIFTNSGGFTKRSTSISFDGAFAINYYFEPTYVPDGSMIMYYWTQADYNAAATLTPANATGKVVMKDPSQYKATVEGIAAKDIDRTVYISAGYMSDGVSYCTGVLAYSIGAYCVSKAASATDMQSFAAATAVYGYYAKAYLYDEA